MRTLLPTLLLAACTAPDLFPEGWTTSAIPAPELPAGDAAAGWDVVRYGGYVGSGVPYDAWIDLMGPDTRNRLDREGDAAVLPYSFNSFDSPNGVRVVGGVNCMGCHSSWIDGEFVIGLGDAFSDHTDSVSTNIRALSALVEGRYTDDSPEWEAFEPYARGIAATADATLMPFAGPNPAMLFEEHASSWRDPATLEWRSERSFEPAELRLGSDVPPWWHMKKKNALYYNGMGRDDLVRQIMQISVLALTELDQLPAMEDDFADVLAFVQSIEAPAYPREVDSTAAAAGEALFTARCTRCHGTYGEVETYPNLVVAVGEVGTDPAYADHFATASPLVEWVGASWYGEQADLRAERGYVAPPLDGVWATAPYLHNGSVPSLATLLDSSTRPERWRRSFDSSALDHDAMGWPWEPSEDAAWDVYDTTLPGYGRDGHTYADTLSDEERGQLLTYLKTL